MKKTIIFLAIMMLFCGYSVGQQYSFLGEEESQSMFDDTKSSTDGFFNSNYVEYREYSGEWGVMPLLPQTHGYHYDYPAWMEVPVGSGWLLLAGMGLGYAIRKRKTKS